MTFSFDVSRVKGILFDLDGTLIDSLPDLHYGVQTVLAAWKLEPMTMEEVGRFVGKGMLRLAQDILAARLPNASPEEVDRFVKEYIGVLAREGDARTRAIPGVKPALEMFRDAGIPMALVTNKAGSLIDAVLRQTGISEFLKPELRFSVDDVPNPKPAPDMLLLAAERMGVKPGDCVLFGDSRNDAEAATRARMPVILLETGYNEGVPIRIWGEENGFRDVFPSMDAAAEAFCKVRG